MMDLLLLMSAVVYLLSPLGGAPHPEKESELYVQIITLKTQAELDHTLA